MPVPLFLIMSDSVLHNMGGWNEEMGAYWNGEQVCVGEAGTEEQKLDTIPKEINKLNTNDGKNHRS